MGKRVKPAVAPSRTAKRVRELVFQHGVAAVSEKLHVGREQVLCIAGELPASPAAIAFAEENLRAADKVA